MKRIALILILLCATVVLFAQVASEEWDYFGFFYGNVKQGSEYIITLSVDVIIPANDARTVWAVFGYTVAYNIGEVCVYFEYYPAFLKRQGQGFRVLARWNGISPEFHVPTFYVMEVVE